MSSAKPWVRACFIIAGICASLSGCGMNDPRAAFAAGDYETSFRQWLVAAENGEGEARNYVGIHYHLGLGVERDYKTAVHWYWLAAEVGNADAQRNLGTMYQLGLGVSQDKMRAYACYSAAARLGHPRAWVYIETMANQLTANQVMEAKQLASAMLEDIRKNAHPGPENEPL
jgi:TPR repeat protein